MFDLFIYLYGLTHFSNHCSIYLSIDPLTDPFRPPSKSPQVLRLRGGGKVHGSLARAGKVKGQTPKVEKQEKRKTPRGRAKKRILYSRRFLNVATGVGGKRLGVRASLPPSMRLGWNLMGLGLDDD